MDKGNIPNQELVIERVFEAPRAKVWQAWTDPEQVKRWWGPQDFTAPYASINLRVGGTYLFCMRSPDGKEYWSTGSYREIVPLEKIVATDSFADEKGNAVPASHYDMAGDWPLALMVTVIIEDQDGKTKMMLRHAGFPDDEIREEARQGWNQSFDKLAKSIQATE